MIIFIASVVVSALHLLHMYSKYFIANFCLEIVVLQNYSIFGTLRSYEVQAVILVNLLRNLTSSIIFYLTVIFKKGNGS